MSDEVETSQEAARRSEAARAMGRARTEAKIQAARENAAKARAARKANPAEYARRQREGMKQWHEDRRRAKSHQESEQDSGREESKDGTH